MSMVEKLLSLARSDSGQNTLEMRPVDRRETVRRIAGEWRAVVGSRALGFTETIT
jgi:signal transduction histidine kinase